MFMSEFFTKVKATDENSGRLIEKLQKQLGANGIAAGMSMQHFF